MKDSRASQHRLRKFLTLTSNNQGTITRSAPTMWTEFTRADIERVKLQIETRRSEMLARHAAELAGLDIEEAELTILEEAIEGLVRKFNIGGAEVVKLKAVAS